MITGGKGFWPIHARYRFCGYSSGLLHKATRANSQSAFCGAASFKTERIASHFVTTFWKESDRAVLIDAEKSFVWAALVLRLSSVACTASRRQQMRKCLSACVASFIISSCCRFGSSAKTRGSYSTAVMLRSCFSLGRALLAWKSLEELSNLAPIQLDPRVCGPVLIASTGLLYAFVPEVDMDAGCGVLVRLRAACVSIMLMFVATLAQRLGALSHSVGQWSGILPRCLLRPFALRKQPCSPCLLGHVVVIFTWSQWQSHLQHDLVKRGSG